MRSRSLLALTLAVVTLLAAAGTGGSGSKPLRIGLVFQSTAVEDPYQRGVLLGLRRAVRELGVTAKAIASPPGHSSRGAFRYLAQHRYDLILTFGFFETEDLDRAALQYPDRRFAIVDASLRNLKHRPKN